MQQVVEILAEYVSCMQHDATSDSNVLHCSAVEGSIIIQNFDIKYFLIGFLRFLHHTILCGPPVSAQKFQDLKRIEKCIAPYLIGI